jgi:uncharacterized protein YgiM (DUF1202 family)
MKKAIILLFSFFVSTNFIFGQSWSDFSYTDTYTSVSKTCGKCSKPVSSNSAVGMRCPHCGVRWGYENTTHTSHVSNYPEHIPSSGIATTTTAANVRTGPSTEYGVVSTLSANTPVTITGKSGNWVKVKFTDYLSYYGMEEKYGYIRADLLNF